MIGLGILAVFLTGTRGTLIGFLLLIPLVMIALFGRVTPWLAVAFICLALALWLVAAAFLVERDEGAAPTLLDFLTTADATELGADFEEAPGFEDDSIGIRLRLWTLAVELIREAPVLGHGIDSFPEVLRRPELGVPADSVLFTFSNVHNQYLDMVMKMGVPGALLFFGPLGVALVVGLRLGFDPARRIEGLALVWVGGSYAIYGLTQTFYGHASTALQFGVYLGMLMWLAPGGRYGDICQRPDTVS